jgi:hypothetical protein
MYDGTSAGSGGSVVYAALTTDNGHGYDGVTGNTYDFQMIVPERGVDDWASSTAYYFYVELS